MQFYLLSDNQDTLLGLRLSGIDGCLIENVEQLKDKINSLIKNPDIAIVLLTPNVMNLDSEFIYDLKLKLSKPIIIEIPDHNLNVNVTNTIENYISMSLGIKL